MSNIIEIDDIVQLPKDHAEYEEWKKYTFRVVDVKIEEGKRIGRIVRNMLTKKTKTIFKFSEEFNDMRYAGNGNVEVDLELLESTNHYFNIEVSRLKIIKKNNNYLANVKRKELFKNATF